MSAAAGVDVAEELFEPAMLPPIDSHVGLAPRVNLLPPEIAERAAVRKLAAALAGAVALCALGVGGAYLQAGQGRSAAETQISQEQSRHTALLAQQSSLQSARQAETQLQATQAALRSAMGTEVLWSRYMDQLRLTRPEGTRFSQVSLTSTTGAGPASGSSTSTASAGGTSSGTTVAGAIASLTLTGKANSQNDVAALLDQLSTVNGFDGVYLTSTAGDASGGVLTFTITASVTAKALSHRYTTGGTP